MLVQDVVDAREAARGVPLLRVAHQRKVEAAARQVDHLLQPEGGAGVGKRKSSPLSQNGYGLR